MAAFQSGDTIFADCTIIDGSGVTPRYVASVLVRDGIIKGISRGAAYTTKRLEQAKQNGVKLVDCEAGKWCLSPGFIDMHAHSDLSLLGSGDPERKHEAKISQGVTTEVIGQDGISYAPVDDAAMDRVKKQIAGWNGLPSEKNFFNRWRTVKQYLDVLDSEKAATNAAFLVPQGNLRILTVGYKSREATKKEIDAMKAILRKSLEEGAVGMSSGLTYVPGSFATFNELAQLCEVVKEFDGYYSPHHRSYGKGAMDAYREMIDLAKQTGVRLHLTHATLNHAENEGKADELLIVLDEALAAGCDISLDTYPYLPGSTTLASLLPNWASSAEDKLALLKDPKQLEKIKNHCLVTGSDGCMGCTLNWNIIEIGGVAKQSLAPKYVGKRLAQIAEELGKDPFDTFIEILKEDDFSSTIIQHAGHESNVRKIMRHRVHTGGSDGILTSTKPHPRGWGTFPRYLGHYGRDLARGKQRDIYIASGEDGHFEDAVAHLTSRPAAILKLKDRGLVQEGYCADLVLFDPIVVRDAATFAKPKQPAKGIRFVMVNGVLAVNEGKTNASRSGRTIRLRKQGSEYVVK
ncbi:N-acyl-D-amino-acid deacylase [Polychaeton citri CBS 116435]|uniref:N-acyl-D-amino-acid deacylase n=1 Tax=Polychaeton citri CBS 116435 TaxID=1314669 RepID=A0A9P4QFE9_9PEZI|nr:N-acyl-D-amino-acid deacylase [Polychaeton citri CBS 116435]